MAYRKIEDRMWTDPEFRACDAPAKLLFLYFITSPHGHLCGLYCLPKYIIQHETGLDAATLARGIDTLSKRHLAQYDHDREVVWVVNMLRYQGSGAKVNKAAAKQLEQVHNSPLAREFLAHYPHVLGEEAHALTIPHGCPIDRASNKEQEQETEAGTGGGIFPPVLSKSCPSERTRIMLESMAAERGLDLFKAAADAGVSIPIQAANVTKLRTFLELLPRLSVDDRRRREQRAALVRDTSRREPIWHNLQQLTKDPRGAFALLEQQAASDQSVLLGRLDNHLREAYGACFLSALEKAQDVGMGEAAMIRLEDVQPVLHALHASEGQQETPPPPPASNPESHYRRATKAAATAASH